MLRLLSIVVAAQAATLSAYAASDITLAAMAKGRLYVLGMTERPHTLVVLDQQFRTESDDNGAFQYELTYHPAPCIVSATIDGRAYRAVVSNCSQQGFFGPSQSSGAVAAARPEPALDQPAKVKAPAEVPRSPGSNLSSNATLPEGQVRTNHFQSNLSAMNKDDSRIKDEMKGASLISHPPLPPQRPRLQVNAQVRSSRAAETTKNAKPVRRSDPRNVEGWLGN